MESNIIWHIGIVVNDIEKTAKNYSQLFGIKLPEIISVKPEEPTFYKDGCFQIEHKMAFFKMGLVQIELIEPNSQPSTWRDFLDKFGEGVHHVSINVRDPKQAVSFLEDKGIKALQKADFEGGSYAYMDARPQLGVILELFEKLK